MSPFAKAVLAELAHHCDDYRIDEPDIGKTPGSFQPRMIVTTRGAALPDDAKERLEHLAYTMPPAFLRPKIEYVVT